MQCTVQEYVAIFGAASLSTERLSTKILYVYFKVRERRQNTIAAAADDDERSSDRRPGRSGQDEPATHGPRAPIGVSFRFSRLSGLSSRGPKYSTWPGMVSSWLRITTLHATSVYHCSSFQLAYYRKWHSATVTENIWQCIRYSDSTRSSSPGPEI